MKIKSNYKLRTIAGENIIVNQGTTDVNLTHIISLNSSACVLWEKLWDKDFELEDAAQILEDTYHISHEQALQDALKWVDALKNCDIL